MRKKLSHDAGGGTAVQAARFSSELHRRRRRYEKIFKLAEDGVVFHEAGGPELLGPFIEANPAICRMLGYTRSEMQALTPLDIMLPEDRKRVPKEIETVLRIHVLRHEKTLVTKDGRHIPVEIVTRHFQQDNQPMILSIIRDISDRKAAESAMRESEERLRLFIEHAPAAIAMFDRQMRYMSVSNRWRRDYGLAGRDLRGLSHYEVFPEVPEQWKAVHRRVLAGEVMRAEEDRFERADGSVQWLKWEVRPWYDDGGQVAGVLMFTEDITRRKEAEEALRRSQEQLRLFIENAPVAMAMFDRQMRYLSASNRWIHYYGLEGRDLRGVCHYEVFPEMPESWREHHCRGMQGEVLREENESYMRPDGSVRWLIWELRPWYDAAGQIGGIIIFNEDITERKQWEEALRMSEGRLMIAKESADLGIYDWDIRANTVFWDERVREIWGVGADEPLEYEKFLTAVHPDDRQRVQATVDRAMDPRSGGRYHIEYRVTNRLDGIERWVQASGAVFFEAGRPVRMVGTIQDVTERKEAEAALRYSQGLLSGAEALSHTGAWEWDVAGDRWTFSEEWQRIHGCYQRTMRSVELLPLAARADRRAVMRGMTKIQRGEEPYDVEYRIIRQSDGQERCVHARGQTLRDEAGRVVKVYGFTQDITERRQAEDELRRALGLLEGIAQGAEDQIAAVDGELRYIFFNEAYRRELKRVWGIDLRIGMSMIDMLAPWPEDQRSAQSLWGRALQGESFHRTGEFGPPEDRQVYFLRFNPIFDSKGRQIGAGHIMHNVTDQVRVQRALQEFNETLERRVTERTEEVQRKAEQLRALALELGQAEQRERKRLAKILHDHIQQFIVAARMQLGWIEHSEDLYEVHSTAHEVNGILEEALTASRSLAVDLSPPVLHEAGLTGGLGWLASDMARKNQFHIRLLTDPTAEPELEETRVLVFECVRELLFNAVKHSGVSEAEVTLTRADREHIRLIVSDRGKGFDPDVLRKRRPNEATFGLFSIQERLAHIGGRMEIDTAPGQGSRIVLTVPAGEAPQVAEAALEAERHPERTECLRVRRKSELRSVLIVDDHRIMREGLTKMLRFEPEIEIVGEAADGPEAIELADKLNPDVIIMDVNLGEMSGVEATRRILERHPEIKVVGLSMHLDESVAQAMREAGAATYLTKSGPSEELIAAVKEARRQ